MKLAVVSLCVNNEHGHLLEHLSAAHFATDERGYDTMPVLELESPWALEDDDDPDNPNPTFVEGSTAISVADELFPFLDRRFGVGNVHWNGYAMLPETAQRLAVFLHGVGWYVDAAAEGQPFLPSELLG